MTHAVPLTCAVPSKYLPPCVSLQDWLDELTHLWTYVDASGDQEKIDACTAAFSRYPGAQENLLQASDLVREIRPLLGLSAEEQPVSRPGMPFANIPLSSPEAAHAVQTSGPDSTEAETGSSEEVSQEGGSGSDGGEGEAEDPAGETPEDSGADDDITDVPEMLQISSGDPQWPEGSLGLGLISGLAATLKPKEMVQLIIARVKDELRITVQPSKIEGESDGTCLALQVTGSPQQLDAELLGAMSGYQQVRQTARQATDTLLAQVQAAAETSKKNAAKAAAKMPAKTPAKPPTPQDGKSVVTLAVKMGGKAPDQKYKYAFVSDIKANSTSGDSQQLSNPVRLMPGTYMLTLSSDKYATVTKTLKVEQGKSQIMDLDLTVTSGIPGLF